MVLPAHADEPSKKLVALTFDDGPHKTHTKEILETLDAYDVKATFFVVGTNAERFPDIVQYAVNKGHEIGNHTYTHPNMKGISHSELQAELSLNEDLLFSICGVRTKLFRPPCGEMSDTVSSITEESGYRLVLWDVDTRDWEHRSKNAIVSSIKKNVKDGSVILMHDFIGGETHTPEALGEIIEALRADGYEFVTVSQLYAAKERAIASATALCCYSSVSS